MRLPFAILLALATLFVVLMLVPEGPAARATAHPDYPAMLVGGDGSTSRPMLALGWLFGVLQIALFSALVALGAGRRGLERGLRTPLVRWTVVYVAAWTFLWASYHAWVAGNSGPSVLGLPLPTVMLLCVLWPLPVFYVGLYVFRFRDWVYDDADAARLRELVDRRDRRG